MSFSGMRRKGSRGFEPSFGAAEFPSPTAGQGSRIDHGPSADFSQKSPSEFFYRCQQCGFPLLSKRVPSQGGNANGDAGVRKTDLGSNIIDPVNKKGFCHLCATPNSRKGGN